MNWRFIESGIMTPALNMAIDEALLLHYQPGRSLPVVRFYGWQPATVSIGYFQKVNQEVDMVQIKQLGLGFVRRPTGGRTVLHDQELTYSFVIDEAYPELPASVLQSYRKISQGLLYGFEQLGLAAALATPEEELTDKQTQPHTAVCFDTPSSYELVVSGKKVSGSSQTRKKGVILQHGSIPLEMDQDILFDICRFRSEAIKERLKRSFHTKASAINQLLEQPSTLDEVKHAFKQGFEKAFGVNLTLDGLTAEEEETARLLVKEKYATEAWNMNK